jgi:hypothetical protein
MAGDSAINAYKALRARYYGRDAYDFSEASLNTAAFRTARAGKPDEALKILKYNEELYPNSSGMSVFRGNILLMKGDTTGAETAFREGFNRSDAKGETGHPARVRRVTRWRALPSLTRSRSHILHLPRKRLRASR